MVATANPKMNPKDNVEYFSRYRFARRWAFRVGRYILSKADRLESLDQPAIELGMEAAYKRFSDYRVQNRPGFRPTPDKAFCRSIAQGLGRSWAQQSYNSAVRIHGWPQGSVIHSVSWSIGVVMGCYLALRHYAVRIDSTDSAPADFVELDFNQPCQCLKCQLARSTGGQS